MKLKLQPGHRVQLKPMPGGLVVTGHIGFTTILFDGTTTREVILFGPDPEFRKALGLETPGEALDGIVIEADAVAGIIGPRQKPKPPQPIDDILKKHEN